MEFVVVILQTDKKLNLFSEWQKVKGVYKPTTTKKGQDKNEKKRTKDLVKSVNYSFLVLVE